MLKGCAKEKKKNVTSCFSKIQDAVEAMMQCRVVWKTVESVARSVEIFHTSVVEGTDMLSSVLYSV